MSVSGVPNIRVIIREPDEENLLLDVPNLSVRILQDSSYNVNVVPPVIVSLRTGSYNRFADVALLAFTASYVSGAGIFAASASYAETASYVDKVNQNFSGSVTVTGTLDVIGPITATSITGSFVGDGSQLGGVAKTGSNTFIGDQTITGSVQSNEFKLTAGDVSLDFTGSITTGLFGVSVDIEPAIPLNKYSGASIEYVAQRQGATRMGYILSAWLDSGSISFTEVSNADVGDTSDLTFTFLATNGDFRLRVNSAGQGSGTWKIQSLFKLFPNLQP
jgi:hypothetical protein